MKKTLLIIGLLIFSIGITQAQDLCSWVFNEGSLEYISCTDFLEARSNLQAEDDRIAEIQVRLSSLITSFEINQNDRAWVDRILPEVEAMSTEVYDAITKRNTFLIELTGIEFAIDGVANLPEWVIDQLLVDRVELNNTLNAWNTTDSDISVLLGDLRDAQDRLPPVDEPDTPEEETDTSEEPVEDTDTPEEVDTIEIDAPVPLHFEDGKTPSIREIATAASQTCEGITDELEHSHCVFQTAFLSVFVIALCEQDNLGPDCYDASVDGMATAVTAEDWELILDEFTVQEDPYAPLAVAKCQFSMSLDDNADESELAVCSQLEYFDIMAGVEELEELDEDSDSSDSDGDKAVELGNWVAQEITIQCTDGANNLQFDAFELVVTDIDDNNLKVTFPASTGMFQQVEPGLYTDSEFGDSFRVISNTQMEYLFEEPFCGPVSQPVTFNG